MAGMTIENIGGMVRSGNMDVAINGGAKSLPIENTETPNVGEAAPFSKMLEKSLDQVNEMQLQADRAVNELVAGRNKNIHETMLLLEKADMSFRLMTQVRNKMIDAYREIMRMQV